VVYTVNCQNTLMFKSIVGNGEAACASSSAYFDLASVSGRLMVALMTWPARW